MGRFTGARWARKYPCALAGPGPELPRPRHSCGGDQRQGQRLRHGGAGAAPGRVSHGVVYFSLFTGVQRTHTPGRRACFRRAAGTVWQSGVGCGGELEEEGVQPTAFELGTALALLIFQAQQVDLWSLRWASADGLDPTNVITPLSASLRPLDWITCSFWGIRVDENRGRKDGHHQAWDAGGVSSGGSGGSRFSHSGRGALHAPLTQLREEHLLHPACDMYGSTAEILWDGDRCPCG